jgi:hypothetical protein
MGAYAFEAKAPFRIVRMTTLPLLTGTNQQDWWPGLPAVVFPCGAFFDSAKNNFVISYGINDVDCGYMKLPLADLLEVTKVIRPKLDPIPERHKLKRNKKSKYNELAKRLDEEPEQTGEAGPTESA